jgi:5-methylcytosine-specific restriction protein A
MAWEGSDRRDHLPPDWEKRRQRRFRLDEYRCTWTNVYDERCDGPAEECDHIGKRDDHRLSKLRSLCSYHHGQKSGREGAQAANKRRAEIKKRFRREETHPGELAL